MAVDEQNDKTTRSEVVEKFGRVESTLIETALCGSSSRKEKSVASVVYQMASSNV